MKRIAYFIIGLGLLAAIALAGNNYYQTQQAKQHKTTEATAVRQSSSGNVTEPTATSYELAVVNVSGFDCTSGPAIAQSAVKNSHGVLDAKMTESGVGSRILYDPLSTNLENIKKALPETYKLQLVSQKSTTATILN